MEAMSSRPLLLRSGPLGEKPKPTPTALVARNIRYHLGAESLGTSFFAQVAGISARRARDVFYGRRPASLTEMVALAGALAVPTASFLVGV